MSLLDEILSALSAVDPEKPLVDPRIGRGYFLSLQKKLSPHVADQTRYLGGWAYQFEVPVESEEEDRWQTTLRVFLSGVGPYAAHAFVQGVTEERWWASAVRSNRTGFTEADRALLEKWQRWTAEKGFQELDEETLATILPPELQLPGFRRQPPTLFHALFKR